MLIAYMHKLANGLAPFGRLGLASSALMLIAYMHKLANGLAPFGRLGFNFRVIFCQAPIEFTSGK